MVVEGRFRQWFRHIYRDRAIWGSKKCIERDVWCWDICKVCTLYLYYILSIMILFEVELHRTKKKISQKVFILWCYLEYLISHLFILFVALSSNDTIILRYRCYLKMKVWWADMWTNHMPPCILGNGGKITFLEDIILSDVLIPFLKSRIIKPKP